MVRPTRSLCCWRMVPIRTLRMRTVPRHCKLPRRAITLRSSQRCNATALDSAPGRGGRAMAYHFAESEYLSRRAIAAATIIALHVLVAYLLATGLMRAIV